MTKEIDEDRAFWEVFVASGAAAAVAALMREAGIENPPIPTFDELVASGRYKAANLKWDAINFVDPGWFDRA